MSSPGGVAVGPLGVGTSDGNKPKEEAADDVVMTSGGVATGVLVAVERGVDVGVQVGGKVAAAARGEVGVTGAEFLPHALKLNRADNSKPPTSNVCFMKYPLSLTIPSPKLDT